MNGRADARFVSINGNALEALWSGFVTQVQGYSGAKDD